MSTHEHLQGFTTRAVHAGQAADPTTGAVSVPIYATSTFAQDGLGQNRGYVYARSGNPTRHAFEEALAAVEEGTEAIAYASGMAATASVLRLLSPGDEVVASEDIYGGAYRLFEQVFRRFGVGFRYVDTSDAQAVGRAIGENTKLLWIESPTNPLLRLTDIRAVSGIAHGRGLLVAVDNTFASPYLQSPLAEGADLSVYSTTKYIGGHSDLVGGAVVVRDEELGRRLHFDQNAEGAVPGPFDAYLALRGLKTLALRMERHCANAAAVASFLQAHPGVEWVTYPGLANHPEHELARRQMRGFGGMVSFRARPRPGESPLDAAARVLSRVRIFFLAESLGGVESLIGHPATMTHLSIPRAEREARGVTDNLIRLSVGIEDVEDLLRDLGQALE